MENIQSKPEMDVSLLDKEETHPENNYQTNIYGLLPMFILIAIVVLRISWVLYRSSVGQKTRSQQQRRVYVGQRARPSLQVEPSIYVSPANLPPPPKYEALAPPSYEEVMSVSYPNYQGQPQPIVYPLTHAVAQTSNTTTARSEEPPSQSTVVTVTSDARRTSVQVATT